MARFGRERLGLVLVSLVLAAVSFLLRVGCVPGAAGPSGPGPLGCSGDLRLMWLGRGLAEGNIPYLQPVFDQASGQWVTVEYPVLTGAIMWLFALPGSYLVFLGLSTALMGCAAAAIALIVHQHAGARAWLWAASPLLVCYLAYNYDALAALTAVAGLALLLGRDPATVTRARWVGAAVLFGVGGALKLFPLLFLLPLALWLVHPGAGGPARGRLVRAASVVGIGVGVFVLVNLPVALANPQGWLLPFTYQAQRPINSTTLSVWFVAASLAPQVPASAWMLTATAATAVAIAGIAVLCWRRGLLAGTFPLLGAAITMLAAYLVLNKVFSPQYVLWLLPLLALSGIRVAEIVGYQAVDLLLFVSLTLVGYAQAGAAALSAPATTVLLVAALARLIWVIRFGARALAGQP